MWLIPKKEQVGIYKFQAFAKVFLSTEFWGKRLKIILKLTQFSISVKGYPLAATTTFDQLDADGQILMHLSHKNFPATMRNKSTQKMTKGNGKNTSKVHEEWTNVCPAMKCMQMSWIMSTPCHSDLWPLDNPFVALISQASSRLSHLLSGSKVSVSQQECTLTPPEGVQWGKLGGCGRYFKNTERKYLK